MSTGRIESTEGDSVEKVEWGLATRLAFRFVFAYVVLFYASFSGFFAPITLPLAYLSQAVWGAIVPWVAINVLDVAPPPLVSDGDGLAQWIQFGGCAALALVITLAWSVVGRDRREYVRLHAWLRVLVRYLLGFTMVFYGLAKVFHLQMLPPHMAKLVQPLGDMSPTSLLWIMMGTSGPYSAFTGAIEVLGGVLLFNRRTTSLGALVTLGAMSNVVAMNLAYDVSVKIWSMNLAALTLVLLAPDARRLLDALVLNRPTEPAQYTPLFRSRKRERIAHRVGMLVLTLMIGFRMIGFLNGRGASYNRVPTPLHGIYDVEVFTQNGVERPPLLTDSARWRTMVIERSGLASVQTMDDRLADYLTSVDSTAATVSFLPNPDTTVTTAGGTRLAYDPRIVSNRYARGVEDGLGPPRSLAYARGDDGRLVLTGDWGGDEVEMVLTRRDETDFLLLNRGFHWVQFYPYFR